MGGQPESLPGSSGSLGNFTKTCGEKIYCLFCYKTFDKHYEQNLERFTNSAELWLGKKINTRCLDKDGKCDRNSGCCPNCAILVQEFCQAFDKWKEEEAKVESQMEKLLNKMKLANRGPQSLKNKRKRFEEGDGKSIKEFREDLIQAGAKRDQQQQSLNLNVVHCKVEGNNITENITEYFLGWVATFSAVLCLGLVSFGSRPISEEDNSLDILHNDQNDIEECRNEITESNVDSREDSFLDEIIGISINPGSTTFFDDELRRLQKSVHDLTEYFAIGVYGGRNNMTPNRTTPMADSDATCKNCFRVFASQRSLKQHARYCSPITPTSSKTRKASKRKTINEPQSSFDFQIAHCSKKLPPTNQQNKRSRNCTTIFDQNRPMSLINSSTLTTRNALDNPMSFIAPNTHGIPNSNSEHVEFQQKNPLLARVVFDKLLRFDFSFRDMKQIRLVCKSWYKYSLSKWRSNFTVRLGPAVQRLWGELEMPSHLRKTWNGHNYFTCYLKSMDFKDISKCPYKKYILKGFCFDSDNTSRLYDANTCKINFMSGDMFWHFIGKEIKHLTFEDCTFPNKDHMEQIFTKNLQNLETLTFTNCKMFRPRESDRLFDNRKISRLTFEFSSRRNKSLKSISVCGILPMDLSALLINSPNIQSIELNSKIQDKSHFYQKLRHICGLKQLVKKRSFQINQLHLGLQQEETCGSVLRPEDIPELPLKQLSYAAVPIQSQNLYTTTSISDVVALTTKFAETLKILELFQPPARNLKTLHKLTAKMNHLEKLYCYGNVFEDLKFVNQMPKLKTLYLDFKCLNNLDKVFKWLKGSDYLERLKMDYFPQGSRNLIIAFKHTNRMMNLVRFHIDIDLDSDSWDKVAKWMPNLRILEATLREDGFKAVCRCLPNLKELVLLYGSSVGDYEITGIGNEGGGGETRTSDNLTNIKGLKKFIMKRTCEMHGTPSIFQESGGLQDRSVYTGFLEMKILKEVQIQASDKMTESAITALQKHVPKVKVMRYYDSSLHRYGECCKVTEFLKSVDAAKNRRSEAS